MDPQQIIPEASEATLKVDERGGDTHLPRYTLPVFEGPLELLLYLIRKNEIEITDIPITEITDQYNGYLERMRDLNLEIAAEFILMAATLIQIKSRMLLPRREEGEDAADVEDPREALIEQLMELRKFMEIGRHLRERELVSVCQFARGGGQGTGEELGGATPVDVDLFQLVQALSGVLKRASDREERLIYAPEITLTARIGQILERMQSCGSLPFEELFEPGSDRRSIVLTFLALLELVKQRVLLLFQDEVFGPIRIVLSS